MAKSKPYNQSPTKVEDKKSQPAPTRGKKVPTFTSQQSRFIDLYVQFINIHGMNAREAAVKAATDVGYRRPELDGAKLIGGTVHPHVMEEIHKRIAMCNLAKQDDYKIDAARVLKELARIGFHNPKQMLDDEGYMKDIVDMNDDASAAMQVVGVEEVYTKDDKTGKVKKRYKPKFKPYNKPAALDQLALCMGMQAGRGANTVKNQQTVNVQWAEIFGPAAAPSGNVLDGGEEPDELEKRIQEEERQAKQLPAPSTPHGVNGQSVNGHSNGTNGKFDQNSDEDEYL